MRKITLMKKGRDAETLRTVEVEQLAADIKNRVYADEVRFLRANYPLLTVSRREDGRIVGASLFTDKLPRVCFASAMVNRNRQRLRLAYTGLVLLEVNNLTGYDEAAAIRQGTAQMPQTLMSFVGASGRSVKIVCRGQLVDGGDLPADEDAIRRFHVNLYEKARMAYNAQLGVSVEKLDPGLERTCYMSSDSGMVLNTTALPFYVDPSEQPQPSVAARGRSTIEPAETAPGLDRYASMHHIFEYNLDKAYDDLRTNAQAISDGDATDMHLLLGHLADNCCQTGMPMGIAMRLAEHRWPFRDDKQLTRLVFNNAYREANERHYRGRKPAAQPLKNMPAETLLTMKIDMFLRENYELRKNVMRGVAEYRQRTGLGFDFQDLTEEVRNSITLRALEMGIKCWDKDIRRYINSDDIELYDPIDDYLERLPRWDGRDRVAALAARIPNSYAEWPRLFHTWLRSVVAMWQGKGQLTGNALVPLLIGPQGTGKSSFCRLLLPRELHDYYNDRISFKNEADLNLGLTSFALINLDEFDQITQRQQVVLKYLVSTADLKYRPPYGKAYQQHRRYASFIGTTNDPTPLVDQSGSRRFVCVQVEGVIDFRTPLDHRQLYAQLVQEISDGERYWLTHDEEQALMDHNRQYQRISGVGEMVLSIFRRPEAGEEGEWLLLKDISARLKQSFSGYKEDAGMLIRLGNFLNRQEYRFESRRKTRGMEYRVVEVGSEK